MRCIVALCLVACLAPAVAHAGGLDFAWGSSCWPDNPSTGRSFPCTTNSGSDAVTASFVPDLVFLDVRALHAILDIQSSMAPLPAWWQFKASGCHAGGLGVNADFLGGSANCVDPWVGLGSGGVATIRTTADDASIPPGGERVTADWTLATTSAAVDPTHEYDAIQFVLLHTKSTGTGACVGCQTYTTLVLTELDLQNSAGGVVDALTSPVHNSCVAWQSQSSPCGAVASQNRTWGQVRSLYR